MFSMHFLSYWFIRDIFNALFSLISLARDLKNIRDAQILFRSETTWLTQRLIAPPPYIWFYSNSQSFSAIIPT